MRGHQADVWRESSLNRFGVVVAQQGGSDPIQTRQPMRRLGEHKPDLNQHVAKTHQR